MVNNDKGKKIIILGSAHPLRGGLASFNERLCRAFLENGDEAALYTFSLQYPSLLFPGKTQFSNSEKPDLDIRICVNSINPFNWRKIGKQINRLKPDLLIIKYWTPFMAPCFGTIARLAKKKPPHQSSCHCRQHDSTRKTFLRQHAHSIFCQTGGCLYRYVSICLR